MMIRARRYGWLKEFWWGNHLESVQINMGRTMDDVEMEVKAMINFCDK